MSSHDHENHPKASDHSSAGTARAATAEGLTGNRLMIVLVMMAVAFFGAYNFASARSESATGNLGTDLANYATQGGGAGGAAGGGCGAGGGGCCGGGGGGAPVEAATVVEGDVQKLDVDTSAGSFNPNVIKAKAGVPIELTFSQAPGGCLAGVYFPDFNINEDLTGGAKTVKLPALEKGTYTFYCQMQMISAQIVVE